MKVPKNGFSAIIYYIIIMQWIFGVVLAQGFWQTLFTLFPPYALYLTVEYTAQFFEFIPK